MVLIVDGEILQDNDPRAVAARQRRAGGASSAPFFGGRGGVGGPPPPRGAPPNAGAMGPGPLDQLAAAIGVHGQSLTIPAVWRIPAREVPLIWLLLLGVATMFVGWRVIAAAAVLHVVSGMSEAGGGAPPGGGPAQGRPEGAAGGR